MVYSCSIERKWMFFSFAHLKMPKTCSYTRRVEISYEKILLLINYPPSQTNKQTNKTCYLCRECHLQICRSHCGQTPSSGWPASHKTSLPRQQPLKKDTNIDKNTYANTDTNTGTNTDTNRKYKSKIQIQIQIKNTNQRYKYRHG